MPTPVRILLAAIAMTTVSASNAFAAPITFT